MIAFSAETVRSAGAKKASTRLNRSPAKLIDLGAVGQALLASADGSLPPEGREAVAAVEGADLLVVASPVYRASYTGLFKHLFDLVGQDALAARPVILAATGGSELHGLVIEHQLRPLFGFFGAFTVPTGVYATPAAFEDDRVTAAPVRQRIDRAVAEAVAILEANRKLVGASAGR